MIADSFFLFLTILNFYCIDVLYQFEWINMVYFCKKIEKIVVDTSYKAEKHHKKTQMLRWQLSVDA